MGVHIHTSSKIVIEIKRIRLFNNVLIFVCLLMVILMLKAQKRSKYFI